MHTLMGTLKFSFRNIEKLQKKEWSGLFKNVFEDVQFLQVSIGLS